MDTGATHSIINPDLCNPKWKTETSTIKLKTLQNIVTTQTTYKVPLFEELGCTNDWIYLIECKFHETYDGILGNDVLQRYKAIIDYESNQLKMNEKTIPLHFLDEKIIKFITNTECGLVHIKDHYNANRELVLEEGIYNVQHFKVEVKTRYQCPSVVHVKPQDSWPVTYENYYIGNGTLYEKRPVQPIPSYPIRMNHLNSEEKEKLSKLIRNYVDMFYNTNSELTFTNVIKHRINTTDDKPIFTRSYRYPYVHKQEVKTQIEEMLNNNIIRPSTSPYSAPIWIVPKKDDASGEKKWRLVIDYRKLNDKTIDDKYPIPNMEEILDKLGRSMYFTTLDLAKGFHQVEIDERDVHKTAFSVEGGHYEFLRMPFGLKTAPATFQRLMNVVLGDLLGKICLVYLDDVIIFSTSLEEHLNSIRLVLNRIKKANLKIQPDKCEFLKKETEFLGHIVTREGIKPNDKKVECVANYPLPKTPKEIKQFLGLSGYYRKFIKDYAMVAKPMTKYLKKDVKLNINDPEYLKSFNKLKTLLTSNPILKYPDFDKKFVVNTDASNYALGAVLSQDNHPICFASRTLNEHEINYSTIEKELLAVIWAVGYFRPYLFGRKFTIQTDHQPLQWLFSIKEPNSKLVRWRLKLEEYDYDIVYKRGINNGNADALSRIPPNNPQINTIETANEIREVTTPINFYRNQIIISKITSGSIKIRTKKIFRNTRKTFHIKELDRETTITLIKTHFNPTQVNAILIEDCFLDTFKTVYSEIFQGVNFRIIRCKTMLEDVEDDTKLTEIIKLEHLNNNHRGIQAVYEELKLKFYNPNLRLMITKFINNCEICLLEKYDRNPPKIPYKVTETPNKPREIIHIDVFYTLDKKQFMTLIDKFSKYAMAFPINGRNCGEFKNKLLQVISMFGKVGKIVVDNELGFKASEMQTFLEKENISIHFTSNSNHTSNADIERLHNTINEHIRLLRHDEKSKDETIEEKIMRIIGFYNNTIHSTTGIKPIDFVNGKISEEKYKDIHDRMEAKKDKYISKLNKNRVDVDLREGINYIKEIRGGKNHRRYRKVDANKIDDDHLQTKRTGHKYYKTHVKPKKKYQTTDNSYN